MTLLEALSHQKKLSMEQHEKLERKEFTDTPDMLEAGEIECFWDEVDMVIGIDNFLISMRLKSFMQRGSKTKDKIPDAQGRREEHHKRLHQREV